MRRTMQGRPRTHRELVGAPTRHVDTVQPQQPQVQTRRSARATNFPLITQRIRLNP